MVRMASAVPWMVAMAAMALGVVGCGEQSDDAGSVGAPATSLVHVTDPPAAPDATAESVAPLPTPEDAESVTVAPAATDAASLATAPDSTLGAVPSASIPSTSLGGVTGLDPLPAQADAATDPVVAEAAVRYAYEHWFLLDLDPVVRGHIVEDGEAAAVELQQRLEEVRSTIEFGRLHTAAVAFRDAEHAAVTFTVTWHDDPSTVLPDAMAGKAVFQDGTWRIAQTTLCFLALGIGTDCAAGDTQPVPPPALRVVTVPDGLEWLGPPASKDVVTTGDSGMWSSVDEPLPGSVRAGLTVTPLVLRGLSALGPDDVQSLLLLPRFAGPTSSPIDVAGVVGRYEVDGDIAMIDVVRADDVIVRALVVGGSVDDAIAAVVSMVPADPVPGSMTSPDDGVAGATTAATA